MFEVVTRAYDGQNRLDSLRRLMLRCEALLQALSDQQLVAGYSILIVTSYAACDISAYHCKYINSLFTIRGILIVPI